MSAPPASTPKPPLHERITDALEQPEQQTQSAVKNNSIPIMNHATIAAIGRNAPTNGRAHCRAGRHGTDTNPNTTTTTAGPAQLTQYEAGGGSDPNEVNEPRGYTRGCGTSP
ncbi:hypothetical protein [Rhodococcus sp. ACPA1]|uniref:hypothetical protein n=1 Tax=Rhodococcus sp. ACPA1 TaxID=2028572 RepID=UPI0015C9C224|nr:hypothetical protein [Rhodococcus sp. ACPA1]